MDYNLCINYSAISDVGINKHYYHTNPLAINLLDNSQSVNILNVNNIY